MDLGCYWGESLVIWVVLCCLLFEIDGNTDPLLLQFVVYFSSMEILFFLCSLFTLVEWKSKSEDCEKEIQDWKKKASTATSYISKLNHVIHSKVRWA